MSGILTQPFFEEDEQHLISEQLFKVSFLIMISGIIDYDNPQLIELHYNNMKGFKDENDFRNSVSYFVYKDIIKIVNEDESLYEINIEYFDKTNYPDN